jgi:hypothetical protein
MVLVPTFEKIQKNLKCLLSMKFSGSSIVECAIGDLNSMEWLWPCPYVLDNGHWMDPAEWRVAMSTVSPMAIIWCNCHLEEIPPHQEELGRQFGRSLHVLYAFERAANPKNLRVKGRIWSSVTITLGVSLSSH